MILQEYLQDTLQTPPPQSLVQNTLQRKLQHTLTLILQPLIIIRLLP